MQKKIISTIFLGLMVIIGFSQDPIKKGDYSFLKGQTQLNVTYDYSEIKITKDKKTEQEYVTKKVSEYNEKEAGKGDKWKQGWEGARAERYHPEFEKLFNKGVEKAGLAIGNYPKAKYTLIVKTIYLEFGFNSPVAKKYPKCNYVFTIIETATKKEVGNYFVNDVFGVFGTFDYDVASQFVECYGKSGKMLGGYVGKAIK